MNKSVFLPLLQLQLRLMKKKLVMLIAITLILVLLSSALAFAGSLLFQSEQTVHVTVAVAVEDDDDRLTRAFEMVTDVKEVAAFATIFETTPDEAASLVQAGAANAAVIFPANFINSVISGENLSPRLIVDTSRAIEAILITKLAQSGVRLLTASQQGYLFTMQVYDAFAPDEPPRQTVDYEASMRFYLFVASCGELFSRLQVSSTGALNATQHYLLSGALFFTLLCLPMFYPLLSFRAQSGFLMRLNSTGCSRVHYALAQIIATALAMLFVLLLLFSGIALISLQAGNLLRLLPALLLSALFFACYGFLLSNTGSIISMVILNFLLSAVMMVSFGGLIPSGYLPAALTSLGALSPLKFMHDAFGALFGLDAVFPLPLLAITAALLLLCLLFARLKREGTPS
ncbi:ABC transporter permease [Christensenellaceae bacterium OttesenSCG-928-M15]|nr:ABC transporter permease [Christensenellaceae bacterium OttesenSCG-928-M15]